MCPAEPDLISVVIPTRNRSSRLSSAIRSVLDQTWPRVEVIVVDDASSDGTPELLRTLEAEDERIRVIRNEAPCGGGRSRNIGIAAATGPYVAFLDDDDLWMPSKLRVQHDLMKADPGASAVSCGFVVEFSSWRRRMVRVPPPKESEEILRVNTLGGASMCLTTKATLAVVGGFDPQLRSCQDWDLWIKLCDAGRVLACREALVRYVPHRDTRISNNLRSIYEGRRRLYCRYRARMAASTRRRHLGELIFLKKVLLGERGRSRMRGVVQVSRLSGVLGSIRYLYRYLKAVAP
jgi:glycosyltransferase involved in cell wall biosynthesis